MKQSSLDKNEYVLKEKCHVFSAIYRIINVLCLQKNIFCTNNKLDFTVRCPSKENVFESNWERHEKISNSNYWISLKVFSTTFNQIRNILKYSI